MMNIEDEQTLNDQLKRELVRIKILIDEDGKTPEHKAELFFEQALLYGEAQQYAEAIASYDKALEFKPDDHEAWYNRGYALGKLGRWEQAIASYDKALEFKPDDTSAFYNKACCYALNGQVDSSIQNLQRVIALNPHKYRKMAKTDSDFDKVRSHPQFQALIQE